MKKTVMKLAALLGYLGILLAATGFQWNKLINFKLLALVAVGMACLSLPELLHNRAGLTSVLAKNAITVGILETFLIFFSGRGGYMPEAEAAAQTALSFRPLFYGFCFYLLLHAETPPQTPPQFPSPLPKKDTEHGLPEHSPREEDGDPYRMFRDLGLTRRESEIAVFLLRGWSNGEIADALTIAETTVKKHVSNIYQKLEISRREQLHEKLPN